MPKWQKFVRKATISRSCMASNSIRGSLAATMATISKLCPKIMRPFFILISEILFKTPMNVFLWSELAKTSFLEKDFSFQSDFC